MGRYFSFYRIWGRFKNEPGSHANVKICIIHAGFLKSAKLTITQISGHLNTSLIKIL